ncbi:radical SAM domain protein [Candidatus Magnetomorum sp. HK-1]|nr:radical SAM domain protein [Candidatus Magnetomorum sp. HK-1]
MQGLNFENSFKLYRELWRQAEQYEIIVDFPLHLDIELSGICNLNCEFCFQNNLIKKPLGFMNFDLFKKIIDEGALKGLCSVKLQVRGESFLHPNIFDAIKYAKKNRVLDLQITTNATMLNETFNSKIINSGLDGIIFSVDKQHKNSYNNKIATANNYSSIEKLVKKFLEVREKLRSKKPWVRLQTSIEETDIASINKNKEYIKTKFPQTDLIVINRIQNYKDDEDTYPELQKNYRLLPCNFLMQRIAIFWNGDVTTCCMDYNNRLKLGNINKQSIQEIWLSEKMQKARELHFEGNRFKMPICKHCHACTESISEKIDVDTTPRNFADLKDEYERKPDANKYQ